MTSYGAQRTPIPAARAVGRGGAPLSMAEERTLAERARAGDEAAAGRLVNSHLGFVVHIARRYRRFGLPLNDLVQEGTIGLIHAVRRFDPGRNVRLCTYAAWWIRAHIQAYVVRSWSLVRLSTGTAQRALFFRLRRMMADLKGGAGQLSEDVLRPLALRFKVPMREVLSLARRAAGFDRSLDAGPGADARPLGAKAPAELADPAPNPEEQVAAASQQRWRQGLIARAMKALSQRERAIIAGRYLAELAKTRDVLARELGISAERVRQLEQKALAKLRTLLAPLQRA
ncbi:MAG TPA: RNA polymerase factor sigma-32 [Alphaproteobacteria bacterium]